MNWQGYMPSHVLSYFFNLFLHISLKTTKIFWSCIMFYLHYIISVLLVSNLFIFTKEQSPFPPHCPRCNNENQKDRSEAREKKSVQELSMFTLFLFPSPNLNYVSRDHYIGLLKIFFPRFSHPQYKSLLLEQIQYAKPHFDFSLS